MCSSDLKKLDLLVPRNDVLGKMKLTVGKVYAGLLIVENWKATRFGRVKGVGRELPVSSNPSITRGLQILAPNVQILRVRVKNVPKTQANDACVRILASWPAFSLRARSSSSTTRNTHTRSTRSHTATPTPNRRTTRLSSRTTRKSSTC